MALLRQRNFFERDRERLRLFVKHRTDERLLGRLDWDDVLQDTFIVIQNRYADFISSPTHSILRMDAIDRWPGLDRLAPTTFGRAKAGGCTRSFDAREVAISVDVDGSRKFARRQRTLASNAAIRAEQLEFLRDCMQGMNEMDREILVLRHMEHMTNGEVAAR